MEKEERGSNRRGGGSAKEGKPQRLSAPIPSSGEASIDELALLLEVYKEYPINPIQDIWEKLDKESINLLIGQTLEHHRPQEERDKELAVQKYNELKEETDTTVVTTVVMAKIQEKRVSELGTAAYDKTTYEALADNFATRMGLGRELVTSLEKIHRLYGSPEYSGETRFMYNMIQIIVATYFMLLGAVLGSVLLMIAGAPLFFLITWTVSDGAEYQNVYDKLKIRYKRVREQLISRLKVKSLAPELVKNILEDLKVLDKIIDQAGEFNSILNEIGRAHV